MGITVDSQLAPRASASRLLLADPLQTLGKFSEVLVGLVRGQDVFDAIVVGIALNTQHPLVNQRSHTALHSARRNVIDDQCSLSRR